MEGAGLHIWSNLGFRVLLKDTSAHGLEESGIANLTINRQPSLCPLSHTDNQEGTFFQIRPFVFLLSLPHDLASLSNCGSRQRK